MPKSEEQADTPPGPDALLGLVAMGSACFIWGLGPFWIRILLTYLPPREVVLLRAVAGGLSLLPVALLVARRPLSRGLVNRATWLGGALMAVAMLSYAAAVQFISPSEVNLLFQVNVLATALFGWWFFRERVPAARWVALIVALGGVSLVILSTHAPTGPAGGGWQVRAIGVLLGLGGGIGAACIQVLVRQASNGGGLVSVAVMNLIAGGLLAVVSGGRLHFIQPPDEIFWRYMVLLGVLASGLGSLLVYYALPRISLAQAGVTGAMQPVVTIMVATAAGELLPPLGVIGALLTVGGVSGSALCERQVRRPTPPSGGLARGARAEPLAPRPADGLSRGTPACPGAPASHG